MTAAACFNTEYDSYTGYERENASFRRSLGRTEEEEHARRMRRNARRRLCSYRRREARLKGMILVLLLIVAACFFALFMTATKTEAHKMDKPSYKYYTSVTVDAGDTLWTIAEEHMTEEYRSIDEYMSEVASINHLKGDRLTRGQTLCIPYYSTEYKD